MLETTAVEALVAEALAVLGVLLIVLVVLMAMMLADGNILVVDMVVDQPLRMIAESFSDSE